MSASPRGSSGCEGCPPGSLLVQVMGLRSAGQWWVLRERGAVALLTGASAQWLFVVLLSPCAGLGGTPESGSPGLSWRGSVWGSSSAFCRSGGGGVQAPKCEFSVPSGAPDLSQTHNLDVQGFSVLFSRLVKVAQWLRKVTALHVGSKCSRF